jgi:hypothetical protein
MPQDGREPAGDSNAAAANSSSAAGMRQHITKQQSITKQQVNEAEASQVAAPSTCRKADVTDAHASVSAAHK